MLAVFRAGSGVYRVGVVEAEAKTALALAAMAATASTERITALMDAPGEKRKRSSLRIEPPRQDQEAVPKSLAMSLAIRLAIRRAS
jgi:hypothetical protein